MVSEYGDWEYYAQNAGLQQDQWRGLSAEGSISAMVHIASHWTADSPRPIKVFSNCDEVALYLNEELVAQQLPDADRLSTQLKHPPFTFELPAFAPGTLRAAGVIGDQVVAEHSVSTAGRPSQLRLDVDCAGRAVAAGQNDVVFVHASIADVEGITVPDQATCVRFQLQGDGELIGDNPAPARAGIATVLVRAGNTPGPIIVQATADGLDGAQATIDVVGAK